MEGSFNKAFLLEMDNGREVIAKIACPNAGKAYLMTASEVATVKFLRSRTSIPVPEVLDWSANKENPVGAEYIIMEKVPGVPLAEKLESMNMLERYKIIDRILDMEKSLGSFEFPLYGSIYLRGSVSEAYQQVLLPSDLDPDGLFCIGPSGSRSIWPEFSSQIKATPDAGPWSSLRDFAESIPKRELQFIQDAEVEVQRQLERFTVGQSISEYRQLLNRVAKILPILVHDPRVQRVSTPVLWHADLHLGNIFVCADDPTSIEGIIDWQSAHIAPLFLQARFPEFLRPPKSFVAGPKAPELPNDFDDLPRQEKEKAEKEHELASLSKYYEMASLGHNKKVYNALTLDRRLWEVFAYSQLFSSGSLVPLRKCLVRISQDWAPLGLPGTCPFTFSQSEVQAHNKQVINYEEMLYLWDIVKTLLCTDDTGWVPLDRWESTRSMNERLFATYIETMSDEMGPEAASKKWPFPPEDR